MPPQKSSAQAADKPSKDALASVLSKFNQEHVLAFWDELNSRQQQFLADQIGRLDLAELDRLFRQHGAHEDWAALASRALAPSAVRLDGSGSSVTNSNARARGEAALAAGQVGAILVAGGQGTRLGFDAPKGIYPIGPVSGAPLFQILVEGVVASGKRYGTAVPLFVMTSPATHDNTILFFRQSGNFGLAQGDLHFFCQGTMPAVDINSGKLLLAAKDKVASSPDGHGGMLAGLANSGCLGEVQRRGIRHLFYMQVDNPLVPVCDPTFIGHHIASGSELTTMVIAKQDPMERLGNLVTIDGRAQIIEYSDLPESLADRRDASNERIFWAGSIGVHVFDADFLRRMSGDPGSLPFHIACKKVAHVDQVGKTASPESPNAYKFERFIFDLVPKAKTSIAVEVEPQRAFSPLKNATGSDSETPETVKAGLIALHTCWLREARAEVAEGTPVEISPLFALDAGQLADKLKPGLTVTSPTYFR